MKKEIYSTPDIEKIEIGAADALSVSNDNEIDMSKENDFF